MAGTKRDIQSMMPVLAACDAAVDTRNGSMTYLRDLLKMPPELDEWGEPSPFVQPVSLVRHLVSKGLLPLPSSSTHVLSPRERRGLRPGGGEGARRGAGGGRGAGEVEQPRAEFYCVNFGARDGRGSGGNTDPTFPIFAELGFRGLAVEASPTFLPVLHLPTRTKTLLHG